MGRDFKWDLMLAKSENKIETESKAKPSARAGGRLTPAPTR